MNEVRSQILRDMLERKLLGLIQCSATPVLIETDEDAGLVYFRNPINPEQEYGSLTSKELEELDTFAIMEKLNIPER